MTDFAPDPYGIADEDSPDVAFNLAAEAPLDDKRLWPEDTGTLPFDARCALLQLVRGPYLHEKRDAPLWRALLNHRAALASRLADLFLELCVDQEAGVAFAHNVSTDEREVPKAARSNAMTLLDTIMVLTLRKELQMGGANRVFIGQGELFEQLAQYRNLTKQDQSGYQDRLKASWNRLVDYRILIRSDAEDRFEISPVLKLIFGTEEAEAVNEEFERMLELAPPLAEGGDNNAEAE